MKLSDYWIPTLKEVSKDIEIISHQYSLRAGLVKQLTSGIYTWLPLGLKVIKNITRIIEEEMNNLGGLQVSMPLIQPADLWKKSGRETDYGEEMLRMQDRHKRDMVFGPTHEEVVADLVKGYVKSYKDLPLILYQIQTKFRDEIRPRFGVMRGREFIMKDCYSFASTEEEAKILYNKIYLGYFNIFKRLGLSSVAVQADTGAIGGNMSHEFHVIANTGESKLYYDKKLDLLDKDDINLEELKNIYAATEDMHNPKTCDVLQENLTENRGIEVGHIFYIGQKYSNALGARFMNIMGKEESFYMGCYGIGVSRLVGAIIETCHDDKGIIWPENVAPFAVGLVNLHVGDKACDEICKKLYDSLENDSVLYDNRKDKSAGEKLSTMDLIGLPWQIIVGKRMAKDNKVELKNRKTGEKNILDYLNIFDYINE